VAGGIAVGQGQDGVRVVGGQEEDEGADDQPQRSRLRAGHQDEAHQHAQQQDVEGGVGERHGDLAEGLRFVGDDRRHQEDPAQHGDPHRHDQGVEQAGPITPGDPSARQPQHGHYHHAHAAEVEDVGHAGEGLDPEHPIQQHPRPVADGGEAEAGRQG
jgi:hypothetical protein